MRIEKVSNIHKKSIKGPLRSDSISILNLK